MTHQPARAGFTIMEMIIAFTIMGLMLFLIDKIFFESTRGIEQGMGLSNITISSNIVSDQLHRDFEGMQPPSNAVPPLNVGGIIVIFNKKVNAPRLLEDAGNTTSQIRSDQIAFIYNNAGGELRPVTPTSQSSFEPNADPLFQYVRIWYGHLVRTSPDGTSAAVLGAEGPNRIAKDWILGRQALFLNPTASGITSITAAGINAAKITATINGYSTGNGNAASLGTPIRMYQGLTDVASVAYGPVNSGGTMLGDIGSYPAGVYPYLYGTHHLRVNPSPLYDSSAANYQYSMASWQLAQMHGYFVEHISDFEVAFAGDFDGAPGIDVDAGFNIRWYDMDDPPTSGFFINVGDSAVGGSPQPLYSSAPGLANADAAFVFRHNGVGNWPHLIRIRYRMHDKLGKFNSYVPGTGSVPGMWFETIVRVKRS